jgi:hypothetical protein
MNRRNAMLGWATWTVVKQVLKRKADAKAEAVEEETSRRFRLRRGEEVVEEPKKKRKTWRLLALLSATAVGVGLWMRGRGGKGSEPVE